MSINPTAANLLYSAAKPATQPAPVPDTPVNVANAGISNFAATLREGENTASAALSGNADMPSLVEALAKAELAVETAVTVRNKVVEAYQEILRMPV